MRIMRVALSVAAPEPIVSEAWGKRVSIYVALAGFPKKTRSINELPPKGARLIGLIAFSV